LLYASLPLMPTVWNGLNDVLGGHGVYAIYAATATLFAALLAHMAARGVRSPGTYLLYLALCLLLACLGYLEDNPGEKIHMLQYAVLGILVYAALGKHRAGSGYRLLPAAASLCIAAGAIDECIQFCLPGRSFTWSDVLVNGASSVLTLLILRICLTPAGTHEPLRRSRTGLAKLARVRPGSS
jgi:VanZ family protein